MKRFFSTQLLSIGLVAGILSLTGTSCDKTEFEQSQGVVSYFGDFDQGGCGWVILIDQDAYQGRNLPADFMVDDLPVSLTYKILENTPDCLQRTDVDGMIYIHEIQAL